jgi:hypothetical protein
MWDGQGSPYAAPGATGAAAPTPTPTPAASPSSFFSTPSSNTAHQARKTRQSNSTLKNTDKTTQSSRAKAQPTLSAKQMHKRKYNQRLELSRQAKIILTLQREQFQRWKSFWSTPLFVQRRERHFHVYNILQQQHQHNILQRLFQTWQKWHRSGEQWSNVLRRRIQRIEEEERQHQIRAEKNAQQQLEKAKQQREMDRKWEMQQEKRRKRKEMYDKEEETKRLQRIHFWDNERKHQEHMTSLLVEMSIYEFARQIDVEKSKADNATENTNLLQFDPSLRFSVGTRVECRMGDDEMGKEVWKSGTVIQLHWRENDWEDDDFVPYQIELDFGRGQIFAPADTDNVIREYHIDTTSKTSQSFWDRMREGSIVGTDALRHDIKDDSSCMRRLFSTCTRAYLTLYSERVQCSVTLCSLKKSSQLNGRTGMVQFYDEDADRYVVAIDQPSNSKSSGNNNNSNNNRNNRKNSLNHDLSSRNLVLKQVCAENMECTPGVSALAKKASRRRKKKLENMELAKKGRHTMCAKVLHLGYDFIHAISMGDVTKYESVINNALLRAESSSGDTNSFVLREKEEYLIGRILCERTRQEYLTMNEDLLLRVKRERRQQAYQKEEERKRTERREKRERQMEREREATHI